MCELHYKYNTNPNLIIQFLINPIPYLQIHTFLPDKQISQIQQQPSFILLATTHHKVSYQVRSNFLYQIIYLIMKGTQLALTVLLLVCWVNAVDYGGISNVDQFSLKPIKKGLTYQATIWPRFNNNWAGRFSCNNCNPFQGDQTCDKQLPLVCITSAKSLQRPLYRVAVQYTPFAVVDGGFYEGWTGGVIQVTVPVRGYDLLDYNTGNNICIGYFGKNAKWAKFNDGYYTPYMNQRPISAWGFWDWSKTKNGGWNFWGYFNHHYRGRAWVYVDGQPNGNCGI